MAPLVPAILLIFSIFPHFSSAIELKTSLGILRGTNITTSDGPLVHVFKKVPQAEPPLGDLRYRMPKPPKPWNGIWDATEYGPACMSNSTTSSTIQRFVSEDCLHLNIFTPSECLSSSSSSCPVLVYLHGGKLSYDSAVMFNDSFIAEHYSTKGSLCSIPLKPFFSWVIFVIPSMRLGSFGLLAFNDTSLIPRNLPLYDVIMGLQWVNKEISSFGGDNRKVTLMGHSMGGTIAFSLALSREVDPERKLFQKVIPMSGPVFFATDQKMHRVSQRLLEEVKCSLSSEEASLSCMRNLDGKYLLLAQRKIEEEGYVFSTPAFAPPIADPSRNYLETIKDAPVRDILVGGTLREFNKGENGNGCYIGKFLGLENEAEVKRKFFEDRADPNCEASTFLSYNSQVVFVGNIRYSGQQEAKGANVWLYEFEQPPNPSHAKDMKYFIGSHITPNETEDDEIIRHHYISFITNFVKGNANPLLPGWDKLNGSETNYFTLRSEKAKGIVPHLKQGYHENILNYWLQNMTEFDRSLSEQGSTGTSTFVFVAIGIALFMILVGIGFACRRRNSAETTPLLPKSSK